MSIILCFMTAGGGGGRGYGARAAGTALHKLGFRFTRDNADDKLYSRFGNRISFEVSFFFFQFI